MRTVFLHGETEQFQEVGYELTRLFTEQHENQTFADLAVLLLHDKFSRDGLLAHWTESEVVRFVATSAPRKAVLTENWSVLPDFTHSWLDFLAGQGLLTGDPLEVLHAAVDAATPEYLARMSEPSEWGAEKFWRITMLENGIDDADPAAISEFAEQAELGEIEVDDTPDAEWDAEEPAVWLPPVLPSEDEPHREIAADAPIIRQVRDVLEWAERSGDISQADELVDALGDTDTADVLLEWCARAGLLRLSQERVVPRLIATPMLAEPELLWARLWQRFVLVEDAFGDHFETEEGDAFPAIIRSLLGVLHAAVDPVPMEVLLSFAADAVDAEDDEEVEELVRLIVAQWESMDALSVDDDAVELRPAGRWAARESLRGFGFQVPTTEELRTAPAELVAALSADSAPQIEAELLTRWVEHRGTGPAAAEIVAVLGRVLDPSIRIAALSMLEFTGQDGVEAARGLLADEQVGPVLRAWFEATSGEQVTKPGDQDALLFDGMAASLDADLEGFVAEFVERPLDEQLQLVSAMATTSTSSAALVLDALAEHHPDEKVSGAAADALA